MASERHKDGTTCVLGSACRRAHIRRGPAVTQPARDLATLAAHPEHVGAAVLAATKASGVPPGALTKDMAMAEARRALTEACGADRAEAILAVLVGPAVTEAQKAVAAIAEVVAKSPAESAGALMGGIIGAALARMGRRP